MQTYLTILCPSARLARSIQNDIAKQQLQSGKQQWRIPDVQTLSQWLDSIIEQGLLTGVIHEQSAPYPLSAFNEQWLWEEVIAQSLRKRVFGELFDISGLARAAMEANRYVVAWNLYIPREHQSEETRQFQWQRAFQRRCSELGALENVRYMDWQLSQLVHGLGDLPERIEFGGFDQTAPQEQRLRDILVSRGIEVAEYRTTAQMSAHAVHVQLENQDAECRAAVAWVQAQLADNPKAKLAIVVPRLSEVRNQLADLLDDVFYPSSVRPGLAEIPRHYNFSLGVPLAQQPVIQAALNLLRMLTVHQLQQSDVSLLLLSPFWSASRQELDARALLDAAMRENLPMQFTLARLIEFIQAQQTEGLHLEKLLVNLQAALAIPTGRKLSALQWGQTLDAILQALGWPGERSINSLEYQALNAWQKALQQLAKMEVLDKKLSAGEAVNYLQQICTDQIFQAETEYAPSVQILGIMEGLSAPVDALWCMHMNDHIWPPPARPNPLLPASVQRAAALPNADNHVQAVFAAVIQHRIMHSAQRVIFSSSRMDGDSQLRPSPLMQHIVSIEHKMPLAATLAEQLTHQGHDALERVDDHLAPPVREGEHVSGGTGLLKAQAVCPAWAFYQYRLGAKALKIPVAGLDNMARGSLVHGVLEAFWRKHHYADLRDMSAERLMQTLNSAVDNTIQTFAAETNVASATLLTLEAERLLKLVSDWLNYEKARGVSFRILGCEVGKKVYICGMEMTLKIDRVHQLENGGLEFIDYKTGQMPKISSWGEDRITEPQLPIYATFFADPADRVSGIHFGMVKTAEHGFSGVSEEHFDAESNKRKPPFVQNFRDWQHLLDHWKTAIESIANELRAGEAAVRFNDENDLMYCDVTPLLRLPERKLQFERFQQQEYAADV